MFELASVVHIVSHESVGNLAPISGGAHKSCVPVWECI